MVILISKDTTLYLRQLCLDSVIDKSTFLDFNSFNILEFIKSCYKYVLDNMLRNEGYVVTNTILRDELNNNFTDTEVILKSISLESIYHVILELNMNLPCYTTIEIDSNYTTKIRIEDEETRRTKNTTVFTTA